MDYSKDGGQKTASCRSLTGLLQSHFLCSYAVRDPLPWEAGDTAKPWPHLHQGPEAALPLHQQELDDRHLCASYPGSAAQLWDEADWHSQGEQVRDTRRDEGQDHTAPGSSAFLFTKDMTLVSYVQIHTQLLFTTF